MAKSMKGKTAKGKSAAMPMPGRKNAAKMANSAIKQKSMRGYKGA